MMNPLSIAAELLPRVSGRIVLLFLFTMGFVTAAMRAEVPPGAQAEDFEQLKVRHLESILRDGKQIESFLTREASPGKAHPNLGWTYDSGLGWVLSDTTRSDGIDGSATFYHYEPSGARQRVNFPHETARIHAYGNSFTHCDQVNDGETWQEYLAAHLREPIENYGAGGYSVYQAYLRMRRVEEHHPGRWIILNIFDADHFRNLDAWRSIRVGRGRTGGRSPAGFTLPYLKVNVGADEVIERPNPCPTADSVRKLSDLDWVKHTFADNDILHYMIARDHRQAITADMVGEVAGRFGLRSSYDPSSPDLEGELQRILEKAALFATRKVLEMVESFTRDNEKQLFVVLSHSRRRLMGLLQGQDIWYRDLLDYLETRSYPVVDLREAHLAEYQTFQLTPEQYKDRYYVGGHYNSAGNFFTAVALKNQLVQWLDPPPRTYR